MTEQRQREAADWAAAVLELPRVDLRPVAGDASFRRNFRLQADGGSLILMDAASPAGAMSPCAMSRSPRILLLADQVPPGFRGVSSCLKRWASCAA